MADPTKATQAQVDNIVEATGTTVAEWSAILGATGLAKHGQLVAALKDEHGLTHGNANALAHAVRQFDAGGPPDGAELLAAQYAGAKAPLRPVCDAVVAAASALGDDVEVSIKKTGVSLRRKRQFALVTVPSAKRVSLGFNRRGAVPTSRVVATSGMCTHAVDLVDVDEVDDEVVGWLAAAYADAG